MNQSISSNAILLPSDVSDQSLNRVLEGENCIDEEHTPYWSEYSETLRATTHAWYQCAILIVPGEHREREALALYGKWLQTQLAMQLYPERLEMVPDPADGKFVRTFGIVPCSGIWEPIKVPKISLLHWIFGAPTPQPPFSIAGAMNYLHGGSVAPEICVETDTDNIGTYQDTVTYRRSYTFYFKEAKDETWYQTPVFDKKGLPEFEWNSASTGETTLADGVVTTRSDGVYFITADKKAAPNYSEKGDITVTWNKLLTDDPAYPDGPAYLFKPSFTRSYPRSALSVEAVLAREIKLEPKK